MVQTENANLAEQIDGNSLSGPMVELVLATMTIMVFDRILYSTHKFAQHQSLKVKKQRAE